MTPAHPFLCTTVIPPNAVIFVYFHLPLDCKTCTVSMPVPARIRSLWWLSDFLNPAPARHHSDDEERRSKKKSRRNDRSRSRSRSKSRSERPRGEGTHSLANRIRFDRAALHVCCCCCACSAACRAACYCVCTAAVFLT